jgi:hypothetical protein
MKVCAMCAIQPQWHTWHTLAVLVLAVLVLAVLVLAVLVLVLAHTAHGPGAARPARPCALVLRGQRGPAPGSQRLAAPRPGVAGPSG